MLKYCAALTLFAGISCAADFLTGQAARAVVGQDFFTSQNSGANDFYFGAAGGVAYANNTLFVADSNRLGLLPENNRVLIYNNVNQMFPAPDAVIPPFQRRCALCGGVVATVLGQPDLISSAQAVSQIGMRLPTAVASEGNILAVADTSNNRVLIWKTIPVTTGAPADIVLGQADFNSVARTAVTASALRGPQGVWIQNGRLYVADTQNNRIMIWNSIPTQNNQPADLVLGQPDFTGAPPINQVNPTLTATANTMNSPVSVTSDGSRLYVADLGYNRVLIWNSIPTQTQQPADIEIGQLDMTQSVPNDTSRLCASNGTDTSGNPTYPGLCATTLSFPRFALSDGRRLYVADGGNDRVMIYNQIPTQNQAAADAVLGQPDATSSAYTGFPPQLIFSAANATPTPTSLAWDGTNLYVADPTNYRILVFTPGAALVPTTGVVNSASQEIVAEASVIIAGTITANNTVTLTVNGTDYKYTVLADDTLESVAVALTNLIDTANSGVGDPNVFAAEEPRFATIVLVARASGTAGNSVTLSSSISTNATITANVSGGTLTGGDLAGNVAAGTLITIHAADGQSLSDTTATADTKQDQLPLTLGNVQVYVDGNPIPLILVSPSQINGQVPFEMFGASSVSLYVRVTHADGSVTTSNAVGIPVVDAHPGIFACDPATFSATRCDAGGQEPRVALAYHGSSFATGTIAIAGTIQAGDVPSITIGGDTYTYTVQATDTLATVVGNFVGQINVNSNSAVIASAVGNYDLYPNLDLGQVTAIRLQAKVPGPNGDGIPISVNVTTAATNNAGAMLTVTATNTQLCCASTAFTVITPDNPVIPGETIILLASGLGLITPDEARLAIVTGAKYHGPSNAVIHSINPAGAGLGVTVISAALMPNAIGIYEIVLEVSPGQSADPQAQLTIEQLLNYSNIVTIPVGPSQ